MRYDSVMKMPKWLVVSLLSVSVLGVLGYGAWWWVTWPERTAWTFILLIREENYDAVAAMFGRLRLSDIEKEALKTYERMRVGSGRSRSLADILSARQRFDLYFEDEFEESGATVEIERGMVVP
jgi:hypothetical protein